MEHLKTSIVLKDNRTASLRLLENEDAVALHNYLQNLSAESRSRFGPHPFDWQTVHSICNSLPDDVLRFIAEDQQQNIVAYMLIKRGMIEADRARYYQLDIFLDEAITGTNAPSVADAWQNSGLGSAMFQHILNYMKNTGYKYAVLWGGVQALNTRAVHFYIKYGFKQVGSFWYDGKDNLDMMLEL